MTSRHSCALARVRPHPVSCHSASRLTRALLCYCATLWSLHVGTRTFPSQCFVLLDSEWAIPASRVQSAFNQPSLSRRIIPLLIARSALYTSDT
ncbi:hypothetical protein BD309DRAFT_974686 [Dichomitus squalens]|uniref:Uncharacterized protein n=1 Tax=Dichomitus squalens TaxID=114155 RepID=A0A4Q9MHB8_9APHY|nr:hypothetical protein BD311DRAFT_762819 [Dichomitus squalens]TBU37128.1 hypothetical protein BD309DRAFT_974686 [Dichomitus squalens]